MTHTRGQNESKPGTGSFFSLARRPRSRQLLRSLSGSEALGVGDVLAGGRILQLDHRAVDAGMT